MIDQYLIENPGNHVPLKCDIPYLHNSINEIREEMALYDQMMMKTAELTSRLTQRKKILSEAVVRMEGYTRTSIRRLPTELLLRIFHIAIDEGRKRSLAYPARSDLAILVLSQVCTRWRMITAENPEVWATITTVFPDTWKVETQGPNELVNLHLEKSRDKALDIHLQSSKDKRRHHGVALGRIMEHAHRWQRATVYLQSGDPFLLPRELPLLKSLSITIHTESAQGHEGDARIPCPSHTILAQSLSHITISTESFFLPAFVGQFRAPSLEKLCVFTKNHTSSTLFGTLKSAAGSLQELFLTDHGWIIAGSAVTFAPLLLPRLKVLVMNGNPEQLLPQVFGNLSVPLLETLRYKLHYTSDYSFHTTRIDRRLTDFLLRIQSPLTTLEIGMVTEDEVPLLLSAVPSLSSLHVWRWSPGALSKLVLDHGPRDDRSRPSLLVPNMLDFTYETWSSKNSYGVRQSLCEVIFSRVDWAVLSESKQLRSFQLVYEEHDDLKMQNFVWVNWSKRLQKQRPGLRVLFIHLDPSFVVEGEELWL